MTNKSFDRELKELLNEITSNPNYYPLVLDDKIAEIFLELCLHFNTTNLQSWLNYVVEDAVNKKRTKKNTEPDLVFRDSSINKTVLMKLLSLSMDQQIIRHLTLDSFIQEHVDKKSINFYELAKKVFHKDLPYVIVNTIKHLFNQFSDRENYYRYCSIITLIVFLYYGSTIIKIDISVAKKLSSDITSIKTFDKTNEVPTEVVNFVDNILNQQGIDYVFVTERKILETNALILVTELDKKIKNKDLKSRINSVRKQWVEENRLKSPINTRTKSATNRMGYGLRRIARKTHSSEEAQI